MVFKKISNILNENYCVLQEYSDMGDHSKVVFTTKLKFNNEVLEQLSEIVDMKHFCKSEQEPGVFTFCVIFEEKCTCEENEISELEDYIDDLEDDLMNTNETLSYLQQLNNVNQDKINSLKDQLVDSLELGTERQLEDGTWQQLKWVEVTEDGNDLDESVDVFDWMNCQNKPLPRIPEDAMSDFVDKHINGMMSIEGFDTDEFKNIISDVSKMVDRKVQTGEIRSINCDDLMGDVYKIITESDLDKSTEEETNDDDLVVIENLEKGGYIPTTVDGVVRWHKV